MKENHSMISIERLAYMKKHSSKIALMLALALMPYHMLNAAEPEPSTKDLEQMAAGAAGTSAEATADVKTKSKEEKERKKELLKIVTEEERMEAISRARILDPKMSKIHAEGKDRVAQINLVEELSKVCGANFQYQNEPGSSNLGWPTVSCKYHPAEKILGGSTNKFLCDFQETKKSGETKIKTRKVKYLAFTGLKNSELIPSVMAGMLARLVGFHSDIYCPAVVKCETCPSGMPYEFGKSRGKPSESTHKFKDAMVEFEPDLMTITPNIPRSHPRRPHGVSFKVVKNISAENEAQAKEMAIEREVWLLWLNFLVEMDPHSSNQKITCDKASLIGEDKVRCDKPVIYTNDYGQSFYRRFQFEKWKNTAIVTQNQDGTCSGGMTFKIFKDERDSQNKELFMEPQISQEAKELLQARLMNISDEQWKDVVRIANTERLTKISPEAFLSAVKKKIEAMSQVSCAKFETGLSVMAGSKE